MEMHGKCVNYDRQFCYGINKGLKWRIYLGIAGEKGYKSFEDYHY